MSSLHKINDDNRFLVPSTGNPASLQEGNMDHRGWACLPEKTAHTKPPKLQKFYTRNQIHCWLIKRLLGFSVLWVFCCCCLLFFQSKRSPLCKNLETEFKSKGGSYLSVGLFILSFLHQPSLLSYLMSLNWFFSLLIKTS